MANFTDDSIQQIRTIVREETDDMRRDIKYLKRDITNIDRMLIDLDQTIDVINHDIINMNGSITRNNVLMENVENSVKVLAEAVSDKLNLKKQVKEHESRVILLEADSQIAKQTLKIHSNQLKSLGPK